MFFNYKAFLLVLVVALVVFAAGSGVFSRFMAPEDYRRRRNLWLWLFGASFIAPSIWLYVLVAAPAVLIASKKDPNPVAMYLFVLLAVPPVRVQIPTLGVIGQVFPMDHPRLLSLTLLLPLAFRLGGRAPVGNEEGSPAQSRLAFVDMLVLAFMGLQLMLVLPFDSATSAARRIFLMFLDNALPYFVVSRACRSRATIVEALASFVIALVVLVPLEVFEFFKGWMLFAVVGEQWQAQDMYFPLHRGPFLRAQTTAGHSIFMGYFAAMALGMWLYLQGWVEHKRARWLLTLTLFAGLVVPLARGPWLGAVAVAFVYFAFGPGEAKRSFKGVAVIGAVLAAIAMSPWGNELVEYLPFVGSVDAHTVAFREQLATASWSLILQNPVFGSFQYLSYLEEFRTGEGIIDLVNTYAIVALTYGLVGAGIFVAIFVVSSLKTFGVVRQLAPYDIDAALLGVVLVACIVGTMLVLATTSFLHAMPYFVWSLLGLTFAYGRCTAIYPQAVFSAPISVKGIRPIHGS